MWEAHVGLGGAGARLAGAQAAPRRAALRGKGKGGDARR